MAEAQDLQALAAEAFIYGFPLVFDLQEVDSLSPGGDRRRAPTPFNRFSHATQLAGPADTFVSINNDTVYSMAQLDVSGGPVRLEVPDSSGRYYVLQFIDAWTNNLRTSGTARRAPGRARSCLSRRLGRPGRRRRDGDPFSDRGGDHLGRWAVNGEDDMPAVRELQNGLTLTPTIDGREGVPATGPCCRRRPVFFEQLRVWMQAFPPAERDLDTRLVSNPWVCLRPTRRMSPPTERSRPRFSTASRPDQSTSNRLSGTRPARAVTAGGSPTTRSTTTSTSSRSARSTTLTGSSSARLRYLERAAAPAAACGETTATRPPTRWSTTTPRGSARRRQPIHAALRRRTARRRLLVDHDVRPARLLPRREPHRPVLDRRPHPGPAYGEDGSLTITMQRDEPAEPEARANWLPTRPGDSGRSCACTNLPTRFSMAIRAAANSSRQLTPHAHQRSAPWDCWFTERCDCAHPVRRCRSGRTPIPRTQARQTAPLVGRSISLGPVLARPYEG